jgi:hypothetical protein
MDVKTKGKSGIDEVNVDAKTGRIACSSQFLGNCLFKHVVTQSRGGDSFEKHRVRVSLLLGADSCVS